MFLGMKCAVEPLSATSGFAVWGGRGALPFPSVPEWSAANPWETELAAGLQLRDSTVTFDCLCCWT